MGLIDCLVCRHGRSCRLSRETCLPFTNALTLHPLALSNLADFLGQFYIILAACLAYAPMSLAFQRNLKLSHVAAGTS